MSEAFHFRDKSNKRDPVGSSTPRSEFPNQVIMKTKGGITILVGNDKGKEFMMVSHPGGSTTEWKPDGSVVHHTNSEQVNFVKGGITSTVDENFDLKVSGHGKIQLSGGMHIEVAGDAGIVVAGDVMLAGMKNFAMTADNIYLGARKNMTLNVEGNFIMDAKGTSAMQSDGNMTIATKGTMSRAADGNITDKGAQVHHNSAGSQTGSQSVDANRSSGL